MSRATATVAARSRSSASGMPRIAVSGLARKFWMMTSWMWPYSRAVRRIANSESARSARRLADADQDAGGERHADPAGVVEHPQPDRGLLVRRAVVRAARLATTAASPSSPASCPCSARPA